MKNNLPTYILGFDVKGGYNNVDISLLNERFEKLVIPLLASTNPNPYFITSPRILFHHITRNPTMKIWNECSAFNMSRGIQ